MPSFWNSLERPIIALAPMEDVTDTARELLLSTADPGALRGMAGLSLQMDWCIAKRANG